MNTPNTSHTDRAHARFGPSSAHRWMACPGSIILSEQSPPSPTNRAAERGTQAHQWAEHLIHPKDPPPPEPDAEMRGYAETFARIVGTLHDMIGGQLYLETKVVYDETLDIWGSIDAAVYADGILHVLDLKTGHEIVEAEENSQLLLYAAALAEYFRFPVSRVILHIVQPSDERGPHKIWETTPTQMALAGRLARAAALRVREVEAGSVPLRQILSLGDHCQWCRGKANCPLQREVITEVFDTASPLLPAPSIPADPVTLSDESIARIMQHGDLAINWIKAVQREALARAATREGSIPGFKVVAANTRRRWREGAEERLAALQIPMRLQPPTVTDALRLAKERGMVPAVEALLEAPPGAPILVPLADRRAPLQGAITCFEE